jgi:hypothetical protein
MVRNVSPDPWVIRPADDWLGQRPHLTHRARQLSIQYAHRELVTEAALAQMGGALWHALAMDEAFDQRAAQAGTQILPLVVESADPAVLYLPWECLCHPQAGFLGRHDHFTLSRRLPGLSVSHPPLRSGPLRVLLFTSQPDDLDPERARLDTEKEQAQVLEALTPGIQAGWVLLEAPDDGRFSTFQQLLKEQEFHLVFLSGHGKFHHQPHRDEPPYATFLFEGETGAGEPIRDRDIASALVGSHVQCVVLAACQSGKAASVDLNAGLARQLLHRGLPHVVGMRESILDRAGLLFAHAFCTAIGQQARVDSALQSARQAITTPLKDATWRDSQADGQAELSLGQWCLPMLLSHDPARPLIDWAFTPQPPTPTLMLSDALPIELPERFIGRRRELRELGPPLFQMGHPRHRLITGPGGQGKTALAGQLAQRLQAHGYPVFAYAARPENRWRDFVSELEFALDEAGTKRYDAKRPQLNTPERQARLLLELLLRQTQGQLGLLLDNLENVQDPTDGHLTDPDLTAWIAACQRLGARGPVLLLTSRWQLPAWPEAAHHALT